MTFEQYIKQNHKWEQAKDEIRINCPSCRHRGDKLYISFTKNVFHCFHCEVSGSLKTFMFLFHNENRGEVDMSSYKKYISPVVLNKKPLALPEDYKEIDFKLDLNALKYIDYVFNRGISYKVMNRINFGYTSSRPEYVVFPIYDENYTPVYHTMRAITKNVYQKSLFPSSTPETFGKSDVLFNIHRAAQHSNTVYITEGVFDCLSMLSVGFNAVASLGKSLSDNQISILKACNFMNVVVCYDGTAIKDSIKIADKLTNHFKNVFICELPCGDSDDPNDLLISGLLKPVVTQYTVRYSRRYALDFIVKTAREKNKNILNVSLDK